MARGDGACQQPINRAFRQKPNQRHECCACRRSRRANVKQHDSDSDRDNAVRKRLDPYGIAITRYGCCLAGLLKSNRDQQLYFISHERNISTHTEFAAVDVPSRLKADCVFV